jgi:hypothetical protein
MYSPPQTNMHVPQTNMHGTPTNIHGHPTNTQGHPTNTHGPSTALPLVPKTITAKFLQLTYICNGFAKTTEGNSNVEYLEHRSQRNPSHIAILDKWFQNLSLIRIQDREQHK